MNKLTLTEDSKNLIIKTMKTFRYWREEWRKTGKHFLSYEEMLTIMVYLAGQYNLDFTAIDEAAENDAETYRGLTLEQFKAKFEKETA